MYNFSEKRRKGNILKNGNTIIDFNTQSNISIAHTVRTVVRLSIPAIFAQLTNVVMQYIDAAMVGSLGAGASASIGLVSTTTWLLNGLCSAAAVGFSVQIAQLIGAKRDADARSVFHQALKLTMMFGILLGCIAFAISRPLPGWLGGDNSIRKDATGYFMIYAVALPATQLRQISGNTLQCSGDMKTPSILNILMCILDVVFNFFLIYPSRCISVFGMETGVWGADLGVKGAALGTALADYTVAVLMLGAVFFKSPSLALKLGGSRRFNKNCIKTAMKISIPAAVEHIIICGAYITATLIIAPLGTVAVAANSLAVTAESFCYMPGYGIGHAATTLVGQSLGAKRHDIAKRFAYMSTFLAVVIMTVTGAVMFFIAPWMFSLLTPSPEVVRLGSSILRIEAFAEPLYAASIVCAGALRGAGDTFIPSILNLVSMWGVRITLSMILVPFLGLHGVWIAMCTELCVRGILFLIRLLRGKWLDKKVIHTSS